MKPYLADADMTLYVGDVRDVLRELPDESVHCVVTSPPYWGLRDYGVPGQLGLEPTPEEYVANIVAVFREVRRVLRRDGTCWLNLGDSYASQPKGNPDALSPGLTNEDRNAQRANEHRTRSTVVPGLKPKDLVGIPWRVAFALQADGWYLRADVIWSKPNPMPESVTDRPTKAHEYLFLLTRSPRYFYDADAIREPAEWARWGDQTVPKHEGTATGAGWIKARPKHELQRPQARRAMELFEQHGLTDEHVEAIRAVGITDAGKAQHTQDGYGKNSAEVIRLAEEAKAALGGYYREFLVPNGRNRRSVWEIATEPYPEAHFATFPTALVEPCIKAGTSERGCCPVCGAPWVRIVERGELVGKDRGGNYNGRSVDPGVKVNPGTPGLAYENKTTGWKPTCEHSSIHGGLPPHGGLVHEPHPPTPCVVLDPFGGSGTTAHVARKLGRRSILIELNETYAELAARRLAQQSLLAA